MFRELTKIVYDNTFKVTVLKEKINVLNYEEILKNIFSSYPDKIIIMISHRNNNQDLFNKNYILKGEGDKHEIK